MQRSALTSDRGAQVHTTDWLILLFLSIVWGSSFILIKKGLIAFEPVEMALLRIEITFLALIPIYFLLAKKKMPRSKLGWAAATGLFGSGIPAFMFAFAETKVSSSVAGILNSLTPIFTWTLGIAFFAVAFTRTQFVGVSLGFLGALLIIALEPNFTLSVDPLTLLVVLATVSYAISGNIVKTHLQNVDPITLSCTAFLFIGIPGLVYTGFTDIAWKISNDPEAILSLGAIAVLALIGTVLANILFFRLIQRTNAVFASSVAYLIPVNAMVWGFIDGESLLWTHFAGMGFILAGIWVLRRK